MAISGHKSVESLKIYKKVSADEKFKMGFILGYALKTGDVPQLAQKQQLVELPALSPPESKPKKKKCLAAAMMSTPNKENEVKDAHHQQAPNSSQVVPFIPQQNAFEIPNEYDFDLQLLSDIPEGHEVALQQIPQNPVANTSTTNTANTQINVQRNVPELPGFNNCSISTINFNLMPK